MSAGVVELALPKRDILKQAIIENNLDNIEETKEAMMEGKI